MKNLILGTAGHIDHGKTTLVKALTGVNTDRLPEEKARGITIELGFADLLLPGGVHFGIIDVPGHERFIRTMVSGVVGMDLVMLVIAADEGVMPQTREHLDVCQLLGVKNGLVVLSKSDLVEPEWLDLIAEEVRGFLEGSFLECAPVIPVSSRTGSGIEQLIVELGTISRELKQKRGEGFFRLPVDRVFTLPGFGTVVTGTLLSGRASVGDEAEILPSALPCRIRGIQTHGEKALSIEAGSRLAINLQGVDHYQVRRGDVVVPKDVYRTTRIADVRLDYLKNASRSLRHRTTLRFHSATYEVSAKVILFDRDVLEPGDSAFARLRLSRPVLLLSGDPFVLRSASPSATVAGGNILDPAPPVRRRSAPETLQLLEILAGGADSEVIAGMVSGSLLSGISQSDIAMRSGIAARPLETAIAHLLAVREIVLVGREPKKFLGRHSFTSLCTFLMEEMNRYFESNPLKEGIGKEELKTRMPPRSDQRFFSYCLAALEKDGKVTTDHDQVKMAGRKAGSTEGLQNIHLLILHALETGGSEPPFLNEICSRLGIEAKPSLEHLELLVKEGEAIKVKSDVFYRPEPLRIIEKKLISHLREKGEISPNEFREISGLSRKFMIPLLEYFDSQKLTIRVEDKRLLRKKLT